MLKRKHNVGRTVRSAVDQALADRLLEGERIRYHAWAGHDSDAIVVQTTHRLLVVDLEPQASIAFEAPIEQMAGVHLDVDDLKPTLHVELRAGARLQVPVASPKALEKLVEHAWEAAETSALTRGERFDDPSDGGHIHRADGHDDFLLDLGVDPLHIVISRRQIESGDITEIFGQLQKLLATEERIRYFRERLWVSVHGYDSDPRELSEVAEVCRFLNDLDDQFPYWLYFLDKRSTSLLMMMQCVLAARGATQATTGGLGQQLGHLTSTWWFPAMNMVAEHAKLTEAEVEELSDRAVLYAQRGPKAFRE